MSMSDAQKHAADFLRSVWHDVDEAQYQELLAQLTDMNKHGDVARWQAAIERMPLVATGTPTIDADADTVRIGAATDFSDAQRTVLRDALMTMHPWRKGPYNVYGLELDCEWRSDWKWQRIAPHLSDLTGRRVLDVGCGSGYHCWRMHGAGAQTVIGIDPMALFVMQHRALCTLAQCSESPPWQLFPSTLEQWPTALGDFDTVFSMGVLYHRRSPIDHLSSLRKLLRQGGEVVVETLVIEGADNEVLMPAKTYAKMRNVWFLPSVGLLTRMMQRAGFKNVRVVDVTPTRSGADGEQRSSEWMTFESLSDFLDPNDPTKTIEGDPAPCRACVIGEA